MMKLLGTFSNDNFRCFCAYRSGLSHL